jgi:lipopolysaccharide/colanic/teichoic acid biosynthesis glycosyltransferase
MLVKRVFDAGVALVGLVLLAPVFAAVAGAVKLTSPGPVFHVALRVGRGGRPFRLLKFRSMRSDAAETGPAITRAADARVTAVGRVLRRFKLDELPQLINVLKGDMSLVGPRPEDARYVASYTEEQRRVLSVRPGITSPASIRYRHEETLLVGEDWERQYLTAVMPEKIRIDLAYLEQRTFLRDLAILWGTFLAVFRKP